MIFIAALALSIQKPVVAESLASDFFNLTPGIKRTYVEKGVDGETTTIDEVLAPIKSGDDVVVPVTTTTLAGRPMGSSYYRASKSGVYLIANQIDRPFNQPVPMLELNKDRGSWKVMLQLGKDERLEVYRIQGEARVLGTRDVLGKRVEVCEVKTTVEIGGGAAVERTTQNAIYAKGIGLVEMTSVAMLGKQKAERTLKLIKIEKT